MCKVGGVGSGLKIKESDSKEIIHNRSRITLISNADRSAQHRFKPNTPEVCSQGTEAKTDANRGLWLEFVLVFSHPLNNLK